MFFLILSLSLFLAAAATYQELVDLDPTDKSAVADLVLAYSHFDIPKAEELWTCLFPTPFFSCA